MGLPSLLLTAAVLPLAAWLGGRAAQALRQPAVLGELLAGVALAPGLLGDPLRLVHVDGAGPEAHVLALLAELGAVLLLFDVGLHVRPRQLLEVGASASWVAAIGILASFAAGVATSLALSAVWAPWHAADAALPPWLLHAFTGAALTATSVGITARVLRGLGRLESPAARIILGAAVLDDVGGLAILAVVAALAGDAAGGLPAALAHAGLAVLGLAAGTALLLALVPRVVRACTGRVRSPVASGVLAVAFALAAAWGAHAIGLAAIVGAFVAGLALAGTPPAPALARRLHLPSAALAGVFFATLGTRADPTRFGGHGGAALGVALLLTLVAVLGKLAAGLGVVRRQADRLVVGVGMVPRGEVGLVFAGLGLASGLLATWQYGALVGMVLATTALAPPWLGALRGRLG